MGGLACCGRVVQAYSNPTSARWFYLVKVTIPVDIDTAVEEERVYTIADNVVISVQAYNRVDTSSIEPG